MDAAPYISEGRTLIPVRYLADALGAQTSWDVNTQEVSITKGNIDIKLTISSNTLTVNGKTSQMDAAPVIRNGRTYLPARYVAEAFGRTVTWDQASQTVTIE
jgi:N-acetylmuramoyl-L-alanine amidase